MPKKNPDNYNTVTEEGEVIKEKEKAKEHIAKYYEELYTAREAEEAYILSTETIINRVKEIENNIPTTNIKGEITEIELKRAIKSAKRNKANGPDNIPNEALIEADSETREIIRKTFNNILNNRTIPEQWQTGIITRLYKGKGKKGKCSNERGITVTSNVGKSFERIINNRAREDVIMTEEQAGGSKGKATADHILTLKELIQIKK